MPKNKTVDLKTFNQLIKKFYKFICLPNHNKQVHAIDHLHSEAKCKNSSLFFVSVISVMCIFIGQFGVPYTLRAFQMQSKLLQV